MILCDGSCERGYHFDCIGLAAVPDGDWFCHECKQVLMARTFLRQRSLLEPSRWLSTAALPFGIGDFVVVLYPTYSHAEMYFGLVHEIGIPSSSFEDRLAIKLQWWPLAEGRSWPHFAAAPDPSEFWEEQQAFWPLLRSVARPIQDAAPVPHGRTAALVHSLEVRDQIYAWQEEFLVRQEGRQ
jgi:hypothetical protein